MKKNNSILVILILLFVYGCKAQYNSNKENDSVLELKLELLSEVDKRDNSTKYTTFKYYVTNKSKQTIFFNNLTLSEFVSDSSGNDIPPAFFILKTEKLKEDNAIKPCGDPHGVSWPVPLLTKRDTLDHTIEINAGETYSAQLKMYACFDMPLEQEGIAHYYSRKFTNEKSVKFQLLYDNTKLKSDMLYDKKIWVGKLVSNTVDF